MSACVIVCVCVGVCVGVSVSVSVSASVSISVSISISIIVGAGSRIVSNSCGITRYFSETGQGSVIKNRSSRTG